MTKLFSAKLWNILFVASGTLMSVLAAGSFLGHDYATLINQNLNIINYKTYDTDEKREDYFKADYSTEEEVRNYASDICKEVESEGIVLLKNEHDTLPFNLATETKVSLFGTGSVNLNCSGQGLRNESDKANYPTFRNALEEERIKVNPTLWDFYVSGAGSAYGGYRKLDSNIGLQMSYINEVPWDKYDSNVRGSFSDYSDSAIVVITRDSTEGADVPAYGSDGKDGNYLALSNEERDLLSQLTSLKNKGTFSSLIVIINTTLQLQMDFLKDERISVDACMYVGNLGMSGINAVVDVLVGKTNPSGKLADTLCYDNFSSPAMASQVLNGNRVFSQKWDSPSFDETQKYYGVYVEGIYVGYRYYETRYADYIEGRNGVGEFDYDNNVAYPFGYGLSYSRFSYSDFKYTPTADGKFYDVSLVVTNSGDIKGKESVQIYLQKPYTQYAIDNAMEVAAVELVGFAKTSILEKGQSETLNIRIDKEDFASYDTYGAKTYILDSGDYFLTAASNAHEASANILSAKGYTTADGMDHSGHEELTGKISIEEQDFITFSTSSETGKSITNVLQDADVNTAAYMGGNIVTYVSRNNWSVTWPSKPAVLTVTSEMENALQSDKEVKASGAMPTMGTNSGYTLAMLRGKDYSDKEWDILLDQLSFDDMNKLLTTCYCITPAIESVVKPETKDQDGPTYCKEGITGSRFPSENVWASTYNRDLIAKVGKALANDCLLNHYEGMWAPGINLHRTPYGGRAHEYFSEDPFLTGKAAEAEIQAIQSYGVIAYPKHYAFNDQESKRNGICVFLNEQSAREIYLKPWKQAVAPSKGNAHALMSAFNRIGCLWASASKGLMNDILRDEFGFEGYVITDMADSNGSSYMSCIDGIVAGTDCWLSSGKNHSFSEYSNNATVVRAMRESAHRILYNVGNFSAAMNGFSENTRIEFYLTWWEILLISLDSICLALLVGSTAMMIISNLKARNQVVN